MRFRIQTPQARANQLRRLLVSTQRSPHQKKNKALEPKKALVLPSEYFINFLHSSDIGGRTIAHRQNKRATNDQIKTQGISKSTLEQQAEQ